MSGYPLAGEVQRHARGTGVLGWGQDRLGTTERTAHSLVGVHDRCAANSHIRCRSGMGGRPAERCKGRAYVQEMPSLNTSVPAASRGGVATVPRTAYVAPHHRQERAIGSRFAVSSRGERV
jgi:hypothetical protein